MAEELARRLRSAFRMVVLVVPVLGALWFVPGDDGLRHVGVAFGAERGWGEVYPQSVFEQFGDYDPWWGYDRALAMLGDVLAPVLPDRLARQFVALKLLSAIFIGALLWLVARRSRVAEAIADGYGFALAVLLFCVVLTDPIGRFAAARPHAFGTLLLLYAIERRGFVRGFASSALLVALYPYLAWIYVGTVVVAHLWRGHRPFAFGAAAAALAGAAVQTQDLIGLVLALGRSGAVRAELSDTFQITELAPISGGLSLVAVILIGLFLLLPALPPERRRLRIEHVMLLCFLPVTLVYVRYLLDVVLPLLFVAYGADAVRLAHAPFARACETWRRWLVPPSVRSGEPSSPLFRGLLATAYLIVLAGLGAHAIAQHRRLAAMADTLRAVPEGAFVLTSFNLQYEMLYARPDLSLIPSCELGFAREAITEDYLGYFRHGRVCALATRAGADFFVEPRGARVDATDTACLTPVETRDDVRIWRVGSGPRAMQRR